MHSWLYLLPSVIDDVDMGVTDVVRGEYHAANTARSSRCSPPCTPPRPASRTRRC
ncbi:hypothetical protein AB5I41_21750 [Sphingomonas sp. MMS24-JH45]